LVDLVGVTMLPRCIALQSFFTGFVKLTGSPFVGWIYDINGNYDAAFIVFAIFSVVGGGLMTFIYCARRRRNKRLQESKS